MAQRPGGQRIVDLMNQRRPGVDSVVIAQLDRLGRDAAETLAHLRQFSKGNLGLVSILDRLDLSTAQGRAQAGIAAVFSQLERELIGQRTAEALGELKAQGRVYGPDTTVTRTSLFGTATSSASSNRF
jgi:DNA invertase Pin-like site-specific DNA recombinase